MSRNIPEPDPHSEFEDEGIPDLEDSAPERGRAVDPQRAPIPADQPQAVDDFGTTAEEQAEGEPLDLRTDREVPEEQAMFGGEGEPTVRPAQQGQPDRSEDLDAVTEESGLGVGSDLDTEYETDDGTPPDWEAQPEEPSGQVWEEPRPAGRLVAPDEGAHPDEEPDAVADEVGPDAGGYTAEESAVRVEPE
jgi:hypothetical protein